MDNELRELLTDTDEIHLQLHCTIESVRQCWIALTQGDNEPCEDDYDALFGVYRRLSQLDKELRDNKDGLWKAGLRLSKNAESEVDA
jgi:hypothetical protein